MLRRKIIIMLAAALFSFLVGILYQSFFDDEYKKNIYAKQINDYLHEKESELEQLLDDRPFLRRQILGEKGKVKEAQKEDLAKLKELEQHDMTVLVYDADQLVFWTNNKVIIDPSEIIEKEIVAFDKIKNGYYEVVRKPFSLEDKVYDIIALLPLKYSYTLSSDYLLDHFTANDEGVIPATLQLTNVPTEYVIQSTMGDNEFYLNGDSNMSNWKHQLILLLIFSTGAIFLIICLYLQSKWIMEQYNPTWGATFLVLAVLLLRFLTLHFEFSSMFSSLSLFAKEIDAPLQSPTIGDFIINMLILLSIIYFFYKDFHVRSFNHWPKRKKVILTIANFFTVIMSLFLVISVIKLLVLNNEISYNFNNIFNLGVESKGAILGIILLVTALFLFNQRMMHTIININITKYERLGCLALAIVFSIPMIISLNFMIPIVQIILVTIMYIVLFDLFTDYKRINLTWLVLWLVIYSGLTSSFLFRYNGIKDINLRKEYATKLIEKNDTIAEQKIHLFIQSLSQSKFFRSLASNTNWSENQIAATRQEIDKHYSEQSYLFNNYNFTEHWDIEGINPIDQRAIYKYQEAESTSKKRIRLTYENNQREYLAEAVIPVLRDNQRHNQRLYFTFNEKQRDKNKVYTELLLNNAYKNLKYLSHYDYSIYKNGDIIKDGKNIQLVKSDFPDPGNYKTILTKDTDRKEFIYRDHDNMMVVLGKEQEGRLQLVSLFCFMFSLLVSFTIFLAMINGVFKFLPSGFTFSLYRKPSLQNRIQLSVIALIVGSFFVIGFVTVLYFKKEKVEYHDGRLNRKARTIKASAESRVAELMRNNMDSEDQYVQLVKSISNSNRMDINMFRLDGSLISSSEEDIFNKGIIGDRMNPVALAEIKINGQDDYTQDLELIGNLSYKAMYIPILSEEGKAQFYFGLPYYDKQDNLRQDVDKFMGMLLNVYVFLLLIAGSIAILIANSITQPISKIGEKLKQFKLGGKNEPLEWKSKDELGALIDEYNRMIQKLKDSASLLAQSEREGAWREMAKQVAHEIKNPLTPMKLSIQYLQRATKSGADKAAVESLILRVSETLIEQIDNLAAIATEFSTFAKMPKAQNEQIALNGLIGNVYELFRERGGEIKVSLKMINKELHVIADKNHLLRVLNNLLKNAIQAIPEDRVGSISINLQKEDNNAVIIVTDNGIGIPEEKRDKVFVPNFTTKSSGTGLGLAMSKNIIESFYGSIYFESEVGVGTSFFVKLPISEIKPVYVSSSLLANI